MLAVFPAPELLHQVSGGNMFSPTKASGPPQMVEPNGDRDGGGKITFGFVERCNVGLFQAMMEVLGAQRYFEANSKGVQAADEMLRIANNLIR
jgi:flagellar basal-body rod protein FlgG